MDEKYASNVTTMDLWSIAPTAIILELSNLGIVY